MICIALVIAALNDLELKMSDIMNAYIHSPTMEKVWTYFNLVFGYDACKIALIL